MDWSQTRSLVYLQAVTASMTPKLWPVRSFLMSLVTM